MKKSRMLASLGAVLGIFALASPALAYEGGWSYSGSTLLLGDSSDNSYLRLSNSPRYCGSTATMGSQDIRSMLSRHGSNISWYIDEECNDGYVRVCIVTTYGSDACNTYRNHGWE